MMLPIIRELPYFDPFELVMKIPSNIDFVFLDSSSVNNSNGRYSFIAYDPFSIISCQKGQSLMDGQLLRQSPTELISEQLARYSINNQLFPFITGLAGYIAYDFAKYIDFKFALKRQDSDLPDLLLGLFDLIISFDHIQKKAWIISSGYPEEVFSLRYVRAEQRCELMLNLINKSNNVIKPANQWASPLDIKSNFSFLDYIETINTILQHIRAGDIYQANLAQRFECALPQMLSPLMLYQQMRLKNPAPFSAYIQLNGIQIASASPERFLLVNDRQVTTCPIKGTIKRDLTNFRNDQQLAYQLKCCPKNQAENLMIVDLMRNDLARVCKLFTINVPALFALESFTNVHHLVSTVQGTLKEEVDLVDLLVATFPGGSITGTPKYKAIEIIDELEPHARGPYCGMIGYFSFNGNMDSSIIIRTFVINKKQLTFHAGSGIVADSIPEEEYKETLLKARALFSILLNMDVTKDETLRLFE